MIVSKRSRPHATLRAGERGAALFIVVLVIMLVSAIGIFAVRVSSLVQVASGYNRRSVSASYVADLAEDVIMADQSDKKDVYHNLCLKNTTNTCYETAAAKAASPAGTLVTCCAKEASEITLVVNGNNTTLSANPLGEVGRPDVPAGQGAVADPRIEITESHPNPKGTVGGALGGSAAPTEEYQAEYTSFGHLYAASLGGMCGPDAVRASAVSKVRAFVEYSMPSTGTQSQ